MTVRELLTDASKWTQKVPARDAEGMVVSVFDPTATCWCLAGALHYCYSYEERVVLYAAIYEELNIRSIVDWNDSHSFNDVKSLVEKLDI